MLPASDHIGPSEYWKAFREADSIFSPSHSLIISSSNEASFSTWSKRNYKHNIERTARNYHLSVPLPYHPWQDTKPVKGIIMCQSPFPRWYQRVKWQEFLQLSSIRSWSQKSTDVSRYDVTSRVSQTAKSRHQTNNISSSIFPLLGRDCRHITK